MSPVMRGKSGGTCSAFGCSMKRGTNLLSQVKVFSFPKDPVRRRQWEIAVRRANWKATDNSLLCNLHFISGKPSKDPLNPDYVPSIFCFTKKNLSSKNHHTKHAKRLKTRASLSKGYSKTKRGNKIVGKRNPSLFLLPKDDQPFDKWKRTIPKKDKILSSKDKIRELQFEEGCIETDYIIKMPDGSLHQIPLRHVLKEDSVPSNLPSCLSVQTNKRKACTPRPCFSEIKLGKLDSEENAALDIPQQSNDFFRLSNEVKNISIPNSWWSVACTEGSIIFFKRNSQYACERRVVIFKDLSAKIFLMNVEVSLSNERCTIGNISQLLQKVDDFIICKNADSGTSGCLGFVEDKRQEFCCTCYKSTKTKRDAQRSNAQILVCTKMKGVSLINNVNKRYMCPKKTVSDLNQEPKHQSSQTKEVFLEAISHLPTEQQTAITSCHSFKTWFL